MIEYPSKPKVETGQFAPEVFPEIDAMPVPGSSRGSSRSSPVAFDEEESSSARTLRPPVKIEFGVNAVWLAGGGKRSTSYNNGVKGNEGVGPPEGFHFSPTQDKGKLKIHWELHHPHHIQSARLELFCRHKAEPIWVRTWGGLFGDGKPIAQFRTSAKNDGTEEKNIQWENLIVLPEELFKHEVVTVARSPYQLKLTVSARATSGDSADKDQFGYPLVAWTHFNVLVDKVTLHWGKPEAIPRVRQDVPVANKYFLARGKEATLDELLAREKKILSKLVTKAITADQDLELETGFFPYAEIKTSAEEIPYYKDMWGDGPLVPICAAVTVKSLAGPGVEDHDALGELDFLWDWQDNTVETLKQRLDGWLGDPAAAADQRSTRITRHFMEETFKRFAPAAFPRHAFNAPKSCGGKRGDAAPRDDGQGSVVFPEWDAADPFPFEIKSAAKRIWASVSSTTDKDVSKLCDDPIDTGVLFQPSIMAGDRFKLAVYAMPWTEESPDQAKKVDAYYDLSVEAAALPHAETGFYTIWREIKATYYASPSFYGTIDTTINAIKTRVKKELGIVCTIDKQRFPNLRANATQYLDATIRNKGDFALNGTVLYLLAIITANPIPDQDYAFDVREDVEDVWVELKKIFRTKKMQAIKPAPSLHGRYVKGTSGAKGVVLKPPAEYANRPYDVVLLLNGEFSDMEQVTEMSAPGRVALIGVPDKQPIFPEEFEVRVDSAGKKASSRHIDLEMDGTDVEAELDYTKGTLWPTRHLNDDQKTDLDSLLTASNLRYAGQGKLTIVATAKNSDDREKTRVAEITDYLNSRVVERSKMLEKLLLDTVQMQGGGDAKLGLKKFMGQEAKAIYRDLFNVALIIYSKAAAENTDWEKDGRTVFYHLRGRTKLDHKFTTGGIENLYCEEKFGISGLTVPAVNAVDRVEKRWLKDPVVVAVHEFGHSFFLRHSRPRFFDSKQAPALSTEHLAHDTCIMNYDADSSAFCAICLLAKRGWHIGALTTATLGQETVAWSQKCLDLMKLDVTNGAADPTVHIRLAMYTLAVKKYLGDDNARVGEAKTLMTKAATLVPAMPADNQQRVWMLRNQVVFHRKLKDAGASTQTDVDGFVNLLKATSDLALDLDVITAANLGAWSNTI